jgi:hypothetical protein
MSGAVRARDVFRVVDRALDAGLVKSVMACAAQIETPPSLQSLGKQRNDPIAGRHIVQDVVDARLLVSCRIGIFSLFDVFSRLDQAEPVIVAPHDAAGENNIGEPHGRIIRERLGGEIGAIGVAHVVKVRAGVARAGFGVAVHQPFHLALPHRPQHEWQHGEIAVTLGPGFELPVFPLGSLQSRGALLDRAGDLLRPETFVADPVHHEHDVGHVRIGFGQEMVRHLMARNAARRQVLALLGEGDVELDPALLPRECRDRALSWSYEVDEATLGRAPPSERGIGLPHVNHVRVVRLADFEIKIGWRRRFRLALRSFALKRLAPLRSEQVDCVVHTVVGRDEIVTSTEELDRNDVGLRPIVGVHQRQPLQASLHQKRCTLADRKGGRPSPENGFAQQLQRAPSDAGPPVHGG